MGGQRRSTGNVLPQPQTKGPGQPHRTGKHTRKYGGLNGRRQQNRSSTILGLQEWEQECREYNLIEWEHAERDLVWDWAAAEAAAAEADAADCDAWGQPDLGWELSFTPTEDY